MEKEDLRRIMAVIARAVYKDTLPTYAQDKNVGQRFEYSGSFSASGSSYFTERSPQGTASIQTKVVGSYIEITYDGSTDVARVYFSGKSISKVDNTRHAEVFHNVENSSSSVQLSGNGSYYYEIP